MAINTADSFGGRTGAFPPDVAKAIAEAIVTGAPVSTTFTRVTSANGKYIFPQLTGVAGQSWIGEGERIPDVSLTTDAEISVPHKLAGIVQITNEARHDAEFDLWNELVRLVQGAFSRDLDVAALRGDPNETPESPRGLSSILPTTAGGALPTSVATALGEIGEAGGTPTHIAMSPTMYAATAGAVDSEGRLLHPDGLAGRYLGLTVVLSPGLENPIVYSNSDVYLVTSQEFQMDASTEYAPAFSHDTTAFRIRGRYDVVAPAPARAGRVLAPAE